MSERALPPVLVLLSDGQPTDDFSGGLKELLDLPWGKKAVRVAIAIGKDCDREVLQKFIGHPELQPLEANNPEALVKCIKWASTVVLQAASAQVSDAAPPPPDMTIAVEDFNKVAASTDYESLIALTSALVGVSRDRVLALLGLR